MIERNERNTTSMMKMEYRCTQMDYEERGTEAPDFIVQDLMSD